jgi:glucoamylase
MATVHWSVDNWHTVQDTDTRATGLDVYIADLPLDSLPSGTALIFTFYWPASNTWEGTDFSVHIT